MRIASYNLYKGAEDTYAHLKAFADEQELDVLCLQEANGWNEGSPTRLKDFSESVGFSSWEYGDSNTEFKLVTFSRLPIVASDVYTEGFWHSVIHTAIQHGDEVLNIWNVHLDPADEDRRLTEVERLISIIHVDEPTIITGDFNSLGRVDQYSDGLIAELVAQGITKFGTRELRYDVTDYLTQLGLLDVAANMNKLESTVPTPANKDKFHAANLRLDYMFASSSLAKVIKSMDVLKSPATRVISDHYPVVMTM